MKFSLRPLNWRLNQKRLSSRSVHPELGVTGLTLVEILISIAVYSLIMGALFNVTSVALSAYAIRTGKGKMRSEGQWALEEVVRHVRGSGWMLHPIKEDVPRNLLAVAEGIVDTNGDGFPDADNDLDGRVNEDWGGDLTGDKKSGIIHIDDNYDGIIDHRHKHVHRRKEDDDEDGYWNEDPIDGIDNDGDGAIDEDPAGKNVDEDGDGQMDEDPVEPVVFYLDPATKRLVERLPDYSTSSYKDYIETTIAENVVFFEVKRKTLESGVLLKIKMQMESEAVNLMTLETHVLLRNGP